MILFLDDSPNIAAIAYQRWPEEKRSNTIWATTAEEAISVLKDYDLEEAYLDHDLGGEQFVHSGREDCGMEIIRWIEKLNPTERKRLEQTKFICHSWNLDAGRKMTERLLALGLRAIQIPFGMG